jgi:hypothetical protein
VSGPDLAAELPRAGAASILSAAPAGPPPPAEVVTSALDALRSTADLLVVDLPRPEGGASAPLAVCDVVLLLAGVTPRHLSDAVAARAALAELAPSGSAPGDVRLVLRGTSTRDLSAAVADHLDLPFAGGWRDNGRVLRDADRGQTPGANRRSSLAALCRRLLDDLSDRPLDGLARHGRPVRRAGREAA